MLPRLLLLLLVLTALSSPASAWVESSWTAPGEAPDIAWSGTWQDPLQLAWLDGGEVQRAWIDVGLVPSGSELVPGTGGESDCWGWGPGLAAWGGEVHLAHKAGGAGWAYDDRYSRWTGSGWEAALTLASGVERGYSPQVAADADGVTVAFQRVEDELPWTAIDTWTLVGGALVASHSAVLDGRADDRLDLVAGSTPGERFLFSGVPDPDGAIRWARSTDAGLTWTDLGEVQAAACGGRAGQPDADVQAWGDLFLTYGCSSDADRAGDPSVRLARISGETVLWDIPVTGPGELTGWHLDLGIGRVGVCDGALAVAYQTTDGGELRVRWTEDLGATWSGPETLATTVGACEGRNTHAVEGYEDQVFVAWSDGSTVRLAWDMFEGDPWDDDDALPDDDDSTAADDDDSAPQDDDDSALDDDDSASDDDDTLPDGDLEPDPEDPSSAGAPGDAAPDCGCRAAEPDRPGTLMGLLILAAVLLSARGRGGGASSATP